MNMRRRTPALSLIVLLTVGLAACGGEDDSSAASDADKPDHVWKDKTGAIDKARDVQRVLDESKK